MVREHFRFMGHRVGGTPADASGATGGTGVEVPECSNVITKARTFDPNSRTFDPNVRTFAPNSRTFDPNVRKFVLNFRTFSPNYRAFGPTCGDPSGRASG